MKRKKKHNRFIEFICAFCTVTGISMITILKIFFPEFVQKISEIIKDYRIICITFFVFFIIFILVIYIIPYYEVKKKGVLKNLAKPSSLLLSVIGMCFSLIISVEIVYMINASERKNNVIENEINYEHSDSFEKLLIEKYILYGSNYIIEQDELRNFTKKELYYIRNGIYAYAGMKFESEYYYQFDWYKGEISDKDFSWEDLNIYQQTNILHIREIEENL